jgi:hypothetical protein
MPDYLDAGALAAKLHVTRDTILAWARRGWIPCVRASQRPVLFDPAEVAKAMRARAEKILDGAERKEPSSAA